MWRGYVIKLQAGILCSFVCLMIIFGLLLNTKRYSWIFNILRRILSALESEIVSTKVHKYEVVILKFI